MKTHKMLSMTSLNPPDIYFVYGKLYKIMQIVRSRRGWKEGRTNIHRRKSVHKSYVLKEKRKKQAAYEKESEMGKLKIRRSVIKQTARKRE